MEDLIIWIKLIAKILFWTIFGIPILAWKGIGVLNCNVAHQKKYWSNGDSYTKTCLKCGRQHWESHDW